VSPDEILLLGALSRMPPSESETRARRALAIILQGLHAR